MNLIVVTERQATASILMRRCNWLIALALSTFIVSFVACAPSHDAPESASPASSATATSDATPSSQQFPSEAKVVRVIDGVTIEVEHEGERFLVRYLGVSIPASADLAEASEFNQFIAQGKTVVLSSEDAGVDFDGAHLRYVFIDGEMVNLKLLNGGWGEVAQFPASFEKFEEFFKAESLARTDGRGTWSVEASSPVPSSSEAPLKSPGRPQAQLRISLAARFLPVPALHQALAAGANFLVPTRLSSKGTSISGLASVCTTCRGACSTPPLSSSQGRETAGFAPKPRRRLWVGKGPSGRKSLELSVFGNFVSCRLR